MDLIFNIPRDLNLLAPTIVPDLIQVGGAGDGCYVVSELSIKNELFIRHYLPKLLFDTSK